MSDIDSRQGPYRRAGEVDRGEPVGWPPAVVLRRQSNSGQWSPEARQRHALHLQPTGPALAIGAEVEFARSLRAPTYYTNAVIGGALVVILAALTFLVAILLGGR